MRERMGEREREIKEKWKRESPLTCTDWFI